MAEKREKKIHNIVKVLTSKPIACTPIGLSTYINKGTLNLLKLGTEKQHLFIDNVAMIIVPPEVVCEHTIPFLVYELDNQVVFEYAVNRNTDEDEVKVLHPYFYMSKDMWFSCGGMLSIEQSGYYKIETISTKRGTTVKYIFTVVDTVGSIKSNRDYYSGESLRNQLFHTISKSTSKDIYSVPSKYRTEVGAKVAVTTHESQKLFSGYYDNLFDDTDRYHTITLNNKLIKTAYYTDKSCVITHLDMEALEKKTHRIESSGGLYVTDATILMCVRPKTTAMKICLIPSNTVLIQKYYLDKKGNRIGAAFIIHQLFNETSIIKWCDPIILASVRDHGKPSVLKMRIEYENNSDKDCYVVDNNIFVISNHVLSSSDVNNLELVKTSEGYIIQCLPHINAVVNHTSIVYKDFVMHDTMCLNNKVHVSVKNDKKYTIRASYLEDGTVVAYTFKQSVA